MTILQIEHRVSDYGEWKKLFDSDPGDRAGSGVKAHRLASPSGDDSLVLIELHFDDTAKAEAMLEKLRKIWGNVSGGIMTSPPEARIVEVRESVEY